MSRAESIKRLGCWRSTRAGAEAAAAELMTASAKTVCLCQSLWLFSPYNCCLPTEIYGPSRMAQMRKNSLALKDHCSLHYAR